MLKHLQFVAVAAVMDVCAGVTVAIAGLVLLATLCYWTS